MHVFVARPLSGGLPESLQRLHGHDVVQPSPTQTTLVGSRWGWLRCRARATSALARSPICWSRSTCLSRSSAALCARARPSLA